MPTAQRPDAAGVIGRLLSEPQQFGFFQATRLLDRWLAPGAVNGQGLSRIGFRSSIALSFPVSEIESLKVFLRSDAEGVGGISASKDIRYSPAQIDRIELTPAFMGLLGISGTLPLFYTEMLAQREHHHKDHSARAFIQDFRDSGSQSGSRLLGKNCMPKV